MTAISSVFVSLIVFGIISGQITSAQRRQVNLRSNPNSQRGRTQRVSRAQPISSGTRINRRGQVFPGHRHFQPDRPRGLPQRLSNIGRQHAVNQLVSTGSNRLRSVGTRQRLGRPSGSRLKALHRQPAPTKSSIADQPRSRNRSGSTRLPARTTEQLKIFARNLKVIDGTKASLPRRTNTQQTGRSVSGKVSKTKGKTPRNSGLTTRNGRVTPRISGDTPRSNRMVTRSRHASNRSSVRPSVRSPLRIRARLRQISSQGSRPARRKNQGPSNINNRNRGGGKSPSKQGGRKDMIAIDDIISLVKAIRGSKEPSHFASNKKADGRSGIKNNNGKPITNNIASPRARPKSSPATTKNTNGGIKTNIGSPYLDLMSQFALMNNEGSLFNSLLSDPLFLREMSSGSTDALIPGVPRSDSLKLPKNDQKVLRKQQTSVIIHPSLQPRKGNSLTKIAKTGNPVQDKMISSLMEQTMKNIREEIQENIRKRLGDVDLPVSRGTDFSIV